jgi:hypothetical protein
MLGELRAYRSELMNDSAKFSRSLVERIWRGFHCNTTRATSRNVSALIEIRNGAPTSGSSNPPRAGPTIPERFTCTPPNVTAEGSSSALTISGTIAPQTGAPKASPIPSAKMHASTELMLIALVHAPIARSAEHTPCHTTALTIIVRRFTMSAMAPAGRVSKKNGAEAALARRESEMAKRQDHALTTSLSRPEPKRAFPTTRSPAISE